MPELPEAEAVVRRLRRQTRGAVIAEARVERPRSVEPQTAETVESLAAGASIKTVKRRGKQVLIRLSNGLTIRIHLGMTGDVYVVDDYRFRPVFARVWFRLVSDRGLIFEDARVLGHLNIYTDAELAQVLDPLGVEPLSAEFTPALLQQLAAGSRQPVKVFLMDQTKVAGLGNIYAAEALFAARIDPSRRAGSLRKTRIARLHAAIIQILSEAIDSTATAYSRPGAFSEGESFTPQVYGHEGEPCVLCRRRIRRIQQGGRSTYYCPGCQS